MHDADIFNWVDADNGKNIAEACAKSFSTGMAPPVRSFLALCELEYHFLAHEDKGSGFGSKEHHRIGVGTDHHCESLSRLKTEFTAKGLDSKAMNCALCESEARKSIKKEQRSFVHHNGADPHWNRYNFKKVCQYWCNGLDPGHILFQNLCLPILGSNWERSVATPLNRFLFPRLLKVV